MKRWHLAVAAAIATTALTLTLLVLGTRAGGGNGEVIRIGHTGSPHLAPLLLAVEQGIFEEYGLRVELKQFGSTAEAGYALLAGRVQVAFIEPSTSFRLINVHDQLEIKIAGSINFPFGATLVVRQDLQIRLHDLAGLTVAAASRHCMLLKAFKHDAQRHGLATGEINFVYTAFDTMLPALEAGQVDAILTRSSYALLAQATGHKVLYQNWDVVPDDACCPLYVAQVEYFMLVKNLTSQAVKSLDAALLAASQRPAEETREAVARRTQFPAAVLQGAPLARYFAVGPELERELGDWVWTAN
ncbi:MAG: ABC transporter substrate-binding protein [Truepera sp.]|nr:ABC transporter substrate-binding protein [Truepera sp.]